MAKTLQTIRSQLRVELRDPDGVRFVDTDLDYAINQSYRRLYYMIIEANQGYFETSEDIDIVSGQSSYSLPSDHYITVRLEYRDDDLLTPIRKRDRGITANYTSNFSISGDCYQYHFEGSNIIIEPTPQISVTEGFKHTYIKSLTESDDLEDDTDTVNSEIKDIWCDYIVLDAAVTGFSLLEALGARIANNITDRYKAVKEDIKNSIGIRSYSPNRNRRFKGFFR